MPAVKGQLNCCRTYWGCRGLKEPPQPYNFGYDSVDEFGTQTYRKEQSDARNVKTGSYGYKDAYGVYRRVEYVA
ncbi:hypothetical protein HPB48_021433 [Haemaphysalis longicornis]|uniref:Cuticle protein n=1 Tax=Haemaphysalis longicornis TaxID=44386 RepID=A0A9J6GB23_HAELO|nr:hypothetical protein HPB48_021433 [Haemaphysalis longicornis]